jgi:hypothetical protein
MQLVCQKQYKFECDILLADYDSLRIESRVSGMSYIVFSCVNRSRAPLWYLRNVASGIAVCVEDFLGWD